MRGGGLLRVEPEIVEASASADNGTNGTGVALDIGATNDHAEVEEPEQSVLTWAELFAEEPPKRNGQRKRPQPASLSLFEWAVNAEEEREAELVGADR